MSNLTHKPSRLSNTMATIVLTCLTAMCLLIFTRIGYNKIWFEKIQYYWKDFELQKESDASLEEIREERWSTPYKISKQIKEYFARRGVKKPVLLFEPNTYLQKVCGLKMPEPVVFYYYTGMKSVWTDSKDINEATHFIRFRKNQLRIDTIPSKALLQKIVIAYKAYPQI